MNIQLDCFACHRVIEQWIQNCYLSHWTLGYPKKMGKTPFNYKGKLLECRNEGKIIADDVQMNDVDRFYRAFFLHRK